MPQVKNNRFSLTDADVEVVVNYGHSTAMNFGSFAQFGGHNGWRGDGAWGMPGCTESGHPCFILSDGTKTNVFVFTNKYFQAHVGARVATEQQVDTTNTEKWSVGINEWSGCYPPGARETYGAFVCLLPGQRWEEIPGRECWVVGVTEKGHPCLMSRVEWNSRPYYSVIVFTRSFFKNRRGQKAVAEREAHPLVA